MKYSIKKLYASNIRIYLSLAKHLLLSNQSFYRFANQRYTSYFIVRFIKLIFDHIH